MPVHIHVYTFVNEGKGLRTGILPVWLLHGEPAALVTILIPETKICQGWNAGIKESKQKNLDK